MSGVRCSRSVVDTATCEALTAKLERQGVNQSELARRLGKTRGDVSQLLSGGRNLTLGTIAELADALGCIVKVQFVANERAAARARRRSA
jgi:transcriptional regulator with XRE-family HTH domain